MTLQKRIELLDRLGQYMLSEDNEWKSAKAKAGIENSWFIPEFIEKATVTIAHSFLRKEILKNWVEAYNIPDKNPSPKNIGIVMAGNIPLVGFHDWLSVFITGHNATVKPSSKDKVLIQYLVTTLGRWDNEAASQTSFAEMLKGCDAYIATGSNNSAGYFSYYFGKYPNIIRRNRTSVAVLTGKETKEELQQLADDIFLYFGLGCRNVTKLYVPEGYDFIPLLNAFSGYKWLADHNKYKNNFDYNLALLILNKKFYMSNEAILLVEEASPFSPISQLHYEFYNDRDKLNRSLAENNDLQCIVGRDFTPFGRSQAPAVNDYADSADTLDFLRQIR